MPEPDLLSSLQPPTLQSIMAPMDTWGQVFTGLSGAGREQNPVLKEAQERFKQQVDLYRLQSSVQRERDRQKQLELGLYKDLLGSESPEGRKMGATGIAQHLKGMGQLVSPGFVESFEASKLSLDQRKQAYISILAAQNDPTLAGTIDTYLERSLRIPKAMIPSIKAEAQSPAIHKLLYDRTLQQEQLDLAKADREERKYDLLLKRQDVAEAREHRMEKEGQERFRQADERLRLSEWAQQRADKKFEWLMAHGPEEKRQRGLDQGAMFVDQWEAAAEQLQKKGYLPPPGAAVYDPAYLSARAKRITFPNDPDWTLFSKHLRADIVGYSRNVQGEIGPRFKQAFDGALGLAENPPDLESLRRVFATMRTVIQQNREGKDTALHIYIRHPDGSVEKVPWKRGMRYNEGDHVLKVE